MSDHQPKWRPSDEEIATAINEYMKRLARKYMGGALPGGVVGDLQDNPVVELIDRAVEKALAEQIQEWIAALKTASGEYKCHPDFAEMWAKAESDPTYWAELLRSSRDAYREQEACYRREVLQAKIDTLDDLWHATKRDHSGKAVEVAFASHVTPSFIREEVDRLAAELAALDKGDDNG